MTDTAGDGGGGGGGTDARMRRGMSADSSDHRTPDTTAADLSWARARHPTAFGTPEGRWVPCDECARGVPLAATVLIGPHRVCAACEVAIRRAVRAARAPLPPPSAS